MPEHDLPTASWARRLLALLVDWAASTFVVITLLGFDGWRDDSNAGFYVLAVYVVENTVLSSLAGGSFGKLATRLRLVRKNGDPRPIDPMRALLRSVLIAAVVPPLVFRPDGRGLHDLAAGSATVTLQTYRSLRGMPAV
ncbi:RDD family protein [Nocardioides ferulae]|uniref:RDD family protein n=1 Tax=Nocardioides ferulae TaxID=2340821 RepID=UPI000EB2E7A9|nr:RDD family protein [Nocardioides ferulae]